MPSDAPDLILLDNDERIVELVTWYLESRGFRVRTARSFGALRQRLAEARPDLLVSDVDLGEESALVELPRLSAEGVLPPTLVVSGFLDAANQGLLEGVREVIGTLAKPFEFEELERAVRASLAGGGPAREAGEPSSPPVSMVSEPVPDLDDDEDDGWVEIQPRG